MLQAFKNYIDKFDMNNDKISHKYKHSIDVMNYSIKYSDIIGFKENDKKLAILIGLLHDIGRFNQIKYFDTYIDKDSLDHGDEGYKVLIEEKEIENFWDNKDDYDLIAFAIKNHNKAFIEKTDNLRYKLFAEFVRDMDKLDIVRQFTLKDIKNDNSVISKDIVDRLKNNKMLYDIELTNYNDLICRYLGFIFDVNNKETLKEFKEMYLKILPKLNNNFSEVKNIMYKYLERID